MAESAPEIATAIVIEPMRVEDVAAVVPIERACFTNPWPAEAFEHEIRENPFSRPRVARLRSEGGGPGRIVGYAVVWLVFETLHIQNVAVHPAYRRRGVARRLLVDALEWAAAAGARSAHLEVRASNRAARRLYERLGFREEGRRRDYYSVPREDAILYRRDAPLADRGRSDDDG